MPGPRRALQEDRSPGGAGGVLTGSGSAGEPTDATRPRLPADEPSHTGTAAGTLPPIRVRGLTKRFGSITAVDDLSFEVDARPGDRVPRARTEPARPPRSGCWWVWRHRPPGSATFGERTYVDLARPQQSVGCVLEANFHPGRSGRNHLRVLAATAGVGDDRVDEMLALVGLTEAARRPAGGYSMGMRQRLALAGALLGDPDYLLLDEPANGLDPEGIRWLRTFLRGYAARGRAVLVSSHLLGEVAATVDDIVVIGHGRLLKAAKMADLVVAEGTVLLRARHPEQALRVLADLDLEATLLRDERGAFVRVNTLDAPMLGAVLFEAGICVYELTPERYDLEERFFAMLEETSP